MHRSLYQNQYPISNIHVTGCPEREEKEIDLKQSWRDCTWRCHPPASPQPVPFPGSSIPGLWVEALSSFDCALFSFQCEKNAGAAWGEAEAPSPIRAKVSELSDRRVGRV